MGDDALARTIPGAFRVSTVTHTMEPASTMILDDSSTIGEASTIAPATINTAGHVVAKAKLVVEDDDNENTRSNVKPPHTSFASAPTTLFSSLAESSSPIVAATAQDGMFMNKTQLRWIVLCVTIVFVTLVTSLTLALVNKSLRNSDFSIEVVPTRIG